MNTTIINAVNIASFFFFPLRFLYIEIQQFTQYPNNIVPTANSYLPNIDSIITRINIIMLNIYFFINDKTSPSFFYIT